MTKKFIALLTALTIAFSFSSLAKDNSSSDLKKAYLSVGMDLGFVDEFVVERSRWVLQYGKMLSADKLLSLGFLLITPYTNSGDAAVGFQGNFEHSFLTGGDFIPGAEASLMLGLSQEDVGSYNPRLKIGLGFGLGGVIRYFIAKNRAVALKFGLNFLPQAIDDLKIQTDKLSSYIGMNVYFHF